ncbi:hypothetical protein [Azospirillum melinis]
MSRRKWSHNRPGPEDSPESSQRLRNAVHKVGMICSCNREAPTVGPL